MKKLLGVMMALGLALGVSACDKKDTTTTTKTEVKATDTAAKPATTADKPVVPADKPAAAPAAGGDIGVAECDDYIKKMNDCATKMPKESAGPLTDSMNTMQKAWRDAASTPEGKTALASGCKQALDAAKSAYQSMGCTF